MFRAITIAVLALALGPGACGRRATPPDPDGPADQTYTIRGRVERLPSGAVPIQIHHEAVPTLVDRQGKVVGMREMTMEFPDVAPGVNFDGLAQGDIVEFVMEVRWDHLPVYRIAGIRELPADTALDFKGGR